MNDYEKETLSLAIGLLIGITVYNPKTLLFSILLLTPYYLLNWILPKIYKFSKPHFKKTPFLFIFLITMAIATIISFGILESIKIPLFTQLYPYQMTLLTFLLGYETFRMYKSQYPNPTNYTLQESLNNHQQDGGKE